VREGASSSSQTVERAQFAQAAAARGGVSALERPRRLRALLRRSRRGECLPPAVRAPCGRERACLVRASSALPVSCFFQRPWSSRRRCVNWAPSRAYNTMTARARDRDTLIGAIGTDYGYVGVKQTSPTSNPFHGVAVFNVWSACSRTPCPAAERAVSLAGSQRRSARVSTRSMRAGKEWRVCTVIRAQLPPPECPRGLRGSGRYVSCFSGGGAQCNTYDDGAPHQNARTRKTAWRCPGPRRDQLGRVGPERRLRLRDDLHRRRDLPGAPGMAATGNADRT